MPKVVFSNANKPPYPVYVNSISATPHPQEGLIQLVLCCIGATMPTTIDLPEIDAPFSIGEESITKQSELQSTIQSVSFITPETAKQLISALHSLIPE